VTTTADVTVITPTIPGREQDLARCLQSVYWQTVPPAAHLVVAQQKATDGPRPVAVAQGQNQALSTVRTTWVLRLADDDWLTPQAIEKLLEAADQADVVYGPDRDGVAGMTDVNGWDAERLTGFYPEHDVGPQSGDLYRTKALRSIGGWCTEWVNGHFHHPMVPVCLLPYEDSATRCVLAYCGFRFRYISYPTWVMGQTTPDRISNVPVPLTPCG